MSDVQIPTGEPTATEVLSSEDVEPVDLNGVSSPRCDLFQFTAADVEKYRKTGKRIDHVRVHRFINGERVKIPGIVPIESATSEWVAQTYGPGLYDFEGCTADGAYVKRTRMAIGGATLEAGAAGGAPGWSPPARTPNGSGAGPLGQLQELISVIVALKSTGLLGATAAPAGPDPMREMMASMMAASHQTQQMIQGLMAQQIAALNATKPDTALLLELAKAGKGASTNPADMIAILKLGADLAAKATGKKDGAADKPSDTELVLDTLRPIIPTLGALMVYAMPEAQRADFMKVLEASAVQSAGEDVPANETAA